MLNNFCAFWVWDFSIFVDFLHFNFIEQLANSQLGLNNFLPNNMVNLREYEFFDNVASILREKYNFKSFTWNCIYLQVFVKKKTLIFFHRAYKNEDFSHDFSGLKFSNLQYLLHGFKILF